MKKKMMYMIISIITALLSVTLLIINYIIKSHIKALPTESTSVILEQPSQTQSPPNREFTPYVFAKGSMINGNNCTKVNERLYPPYKNGSWKVLPETNNTMFYSRTIEDNKDIIDIKNDALVPHTTSDYRPANMIGSRSSYVKVGNRTDIKELNSISLGQDGVWYNNITEDVHMNGQPDKSQVKMCSAQVWKDTDGVYVDMGFSDHITVEIEYTK